MPRLGLVRRVAGVLGGRHGGAGTGGGPALAAATAALACSTCAADNSARSRGGGRNTQSGMTELTREDAVNVLAALPGFTAGSKSTRYTCVKSVTNAPVAASALARAASSWSAGTLVKSRCTPVVPIEASAELSVPTSAAIVRVAGAAADRESVV